MAAFLYFDCAFRQACYASDKCKMGFDYFCSLHGPGFTFGY